MAYYESDPRAIYDNCFDFLEVFQNGESFVLKLSSIESFVSMSEEELCAAILAGELNLKVRTKSREHYSFPLLKQDGSIKYLEIYSREYGPVDDLKKKIKICITKLMKEWLKN